MTEYTKELNRTKILLMKISADTKYKQKTRDLAKEALRVTKQSITTELNNKSNKERQATTSNI